MLIFHLLAYLVGDTEWSTDIQRQILNAISGAPESGMRRFEPGGNALILQGKVVFFSSLNNDRVEKLHIILFLSNALEHF